MDVEQERDPRVVEAAEEAAGEARDDNPDPTTQREAVELELSERELSEEGAAVGDEID